MDTVTLLTYVRDYGGLLIGLVFLLVATSVIPGRAKWYVLTAGLTIIGYEAYIRTRNRKLLAEADKEREVLRNRVGELSRRGAELEKAVAELDQKLADNKARLATLNQEAAELAQSGVDISQQKAKLDEETIRRSRENEALLQTVGSHEQLLSALQDARHAIEQLDRTAP